MQLFNRNSDALYKKSWFWVCITIMVMCLTRPHVKVICGNKNGNGCGGNKTITADKKLDK